MSDQPNQRRAPPPVPSSKATGAWPTEPGSGHVPAAAAPGGLKVVTVAPGSLHDAETKETALPAKSDPYLGCTIDGRYKVEAVLGEGGMGVVYRCSHTIIGKKVAMKVLRADLARDREVTERFLNEAKSASAIGNPHIIDISDFGQLPDGSTYFVMEYLSGKPLSDTVAGGNPLPVSRIVHIARQLAEGLAEAHKAEIVHRDLKPDNIYLVARGAEKDFVKILDFGIAKVSSSSGSKLTRAGAVFGTPHYMSPEQAAGAPIDHRGDIYSFGVILYELASGKVPFDADNFMGILTQHMYKAPVPIRALVPQPQEVPPGLEAIVLKCLSKRPEQRYQSMGELLEDLDRLKQGLIPEAVPEMMSRSGGFNVPVDYFKKGGMPAPVPATPAGFSERGVRWPLVAGLAGVLTAVGLVVFIFGKSADSGAAPRPPAPVVKKALPPPVPVPEVTPEPVESAVVEPVASRQVVLAAEPIDAHVYRDGKDLGTSPVVIDVEEGSAVTLEIRRNGYKEETITLDGTDARHSVKLQRDAPQRTYQLRPPPPKRKTEAPAKRPKSSIGGGEIVNPWE